MNQPQKAAQGGKPKTAITPTREENFPEWYQSVIKAGDMAENSPVRGCMVIKPHGYALWENIQRGLDEMIKDENVQNAYFPLLIPLSFISREADHVEGFAKECAVVTHHRLEKAPGGGLIPAPSSKLEEPFVIRPTSETIIGESMSKWVQSYRDLPLKLNQWCNIMRWEMRTRLFLRTSEFLWQEGHNAFATAREANDDAMRMLEVYRQFYQDYMAMYVIPGEKTADERFPGAVQTFTVEAMMQDGKALQAGTSHDLGQNFARSCGIEFQGEDGQQHLAHTTSWGFSTRSIGGLIMTHADDDGLILPPKIAPHQVAIIPVVRDETSKAAVFGYCETLKKQLKDLGIRVHLDLSDNRAPDKMWACIKKGVPVRVEIGQREMDEGQLTFVRRDLGKDSKKTVAVQEFTCTIKSILDALQADLLKKSKDFTDARIHKVKDMNALRDFLSSETTGFAMAGADILDHEGFESVRKEFSVTPRCLPFSENGRMVLIGRSY